jgi:putative ABC transport system permease protein
MSERVFQTLQRLYPGGFRRRYGLEQLEFFRQERATLASDPGLWRVVAFWMKTAWDMVGAAIRVRLRYSLGRGTADGSGGGDHGQKRESGRLSFLDEVLQDVRFAFRTLRKQPVFTLVAVGVLGLGIGASTTLFSAVNGVLLRPLPYPQQDRLVFLGSKFPEGTRISGMSLPELMDIVEQIGSVEEYAAARGRALDLVEDGEPERVAMSLVSRDYFRVLGATPSLGPGFSPQDHERSDAGVIMISAGLWRRRWGGDPDIVGRTVLASDGNSPELLTFTIVGVLPPGFENPPPLENPYSRLPAADLWAPLAMNSEAYTTSRTNWNIRAVGLIRPGASLESLNSELEALALSLREAFPRAHSRGDTYLGLGARGLRDEMVGSRRRDLMILLGATGLLLLIACANVASLMVARALDRMKEMGLRTALGAGRNRLFRQLLTESLVLALLGGVIGVGLAMAGVWAFRLLGPENFPRMAEVALDLRVLGFGITIALFTGLLFGVGPALAGSSEKGDPVLSSGARGGTTGGRTLRIRGGLVTLEVALALVLLTGCGLLTKSVVRLQSREPGINAENLAIMQVRLLPTYDLDEERLAFFSALRQRLETLSGVVSVSHIPDPPMGFNQWATNLRREEDLDPEGSFGSASTHAVGLGYFRTMGIPLLSGRVFSETDDGVSPPSVVLSQSLAEALWPGENPLGRRLDISGMGEGPWRTVVGVVGDIRQNSLASQPSEDLYLPYTQEAGNSGQFMVIRTAGNSMALAGAFREAVWALDENVPIPEITTMEARVDATLRLPRFRTILLASFAVVALILAGAGIYGTLMYTVGRRAPEVGIRMALGAEAKDVVTLVLWQGLWPVTLGVGLGLVGSLVATRVLESVLFEVSPNDPATLILVAGVLVGVSLLASFLPARKASRVDPQVALRAE